MPTLCNDVLYHIFECLVAPERYPEPIPYPEHLQDRKTLVHCAVACRRFTQPALAALWNALPEGQAPIYRLLLALDMIVVRPRTDPDPRDKPLHDDFLLNVRTACSG